MDQTSSAAAALFKTPSLVNGLLAQMGEGSAQDGLFSNLLSESGDSASALAAQSQILTPTTPTDAADVSTDQTVAPSSGLVQTLSDLSTMLHKALAVLKKQNSAASNNKSPTISNKSTQTTMPPSSDTPTATNGQATANASGSTKEGTTSDQSGNGWRDIKDKQTRSTSSSTGVSDTTVSTNTTQESNAATTGSAVTIPDAQTLATIIAELLAMTQALIKNLQQTQTGTGNAHSGQASGQAATQSADAVSTNINALVGELTAIVGKLTPATAGASPAAGDTAASSAVLSATTAVPIESFAQLVTDLQKTLQKLLPVLADAASSSAHASAAIAASATSASIDAQIAVLSTNLNSFLAATQQRSQTSSTPKSAALASVSSLQASSQDDAASTAVDAMQKADTTTSTKMQITTASIETTKVPIAETSSSLFALQTSLSAQSAPPAPAGQAAINSAALVATIEKNGDSQTSSSSDMSSDDGDTSTFASSKAAEPNAPAAAGVTQATGTYTFASTLSAIRATNGGTTGLPTAVDQVILQMSRSVKTGNDQMSIQLQPGDLGKITVKLSIGSDGKVQGTVTAQNPQTLDMLQKDSRSLERALQDAGLRADPGSLQFSLGGHENGNNAGQTGNNNDDGASEDGTISATDSAGDNAGLVERGSASETYYVTPSGVNIRV